MTKIYLIRHCESDGNSGRRFNGQTDSDISEKGKQQLELLSLRFRNIKLDAIYSSPLKRAYKTAEAVNKYHRLPINLNSDFLEIDVGALENEKIDGLFEKYPEIASAWNEEPQSCAFPCGESMREVYGRVCAGFDKVLSENRGKTVAVVSHGCAIRNLLCRCLYNDILRLKEAPIIRNTAVNLIEVAQDGRISVPLVDDREHLTGELAEDPLTYHIKKGGCDGDIGG